MFSGYRESAQYTLGFSCFALRYDALPIKLIVRMASEQL